MIVINISHDIEHYDQNCIGISPEMWNSIPYQFPIGIIVLIEFESLSFIQFPQGSWHFIALGYFNGVKLKVFKSNRVLNFNFFNLGEYSDFMVELVVYVRHF